MRLSAAAHEQIISTISKFAGDESFRLFLFGSRVDDSKRGGDIDLALVFETQQAAEKTKLIDYELLAALKSQPAIGEQKIDLKIISRSELSQPFYAVALQNAVLLFAS